MSELSVPTAGVPGTVVVNSESEALSAYRAFHHRRIDLTLDLLRIVGARRVIEVGGHPWAMTAALVDRACLKVVATVSAEEVTRWPDDIGMTRREYLLTIPGKGEVNFHNYSANVERRLFAIEERADTVLACEVVEHLIRAPHVLFLNVNSWLPSGGNLVLTTPNGTQFRNPFRMRPPFPAFRAHLYERHAYLYTKEGLLDLLELCGFEPVEVQFWSPYARSGFARIYSLLSRVPISYLEEKFSSTIAVWARKRKDVRALPRIPRIYDARGDWEHVAGH